MFSTLLTTNEYRKKQREKVNEHGTIEKNIHTTQQQQQQIKTLILGLFAISQTISIALQITNSSKIDSIAEKTYTITHARTRKRA